MSYHRAKQQKQAELYLKQRDAERRADSAAARDEAQLNKSRAWLEQYRSTTTKPKDTPDAKEIKEAEPQRDHEGSMGEAEEAGRVR